MTRKKLWQEINNWKFFLPNRRCKSFGSRNDDSLFVPVMFHQDIRVDPLGSGQISLFKGESHWCDADPKKKTSRCLRNIELWKIVSKSFEIHYIRVGIPSRHTSRAIVSSLTWKLPSFVSRTRCSFHASPPPPFLYMHRQMCVYTYIHVCTQSGSILLCVPPSWSQFFTLSDAIRANAHPLDVCTFVFYSKNSKFVYTPPFFFLCKALCFVSRGN